MRLPRERFHRTALATVAALLLGGCSAAPSPLVSSSTPVAVTDAPSAVAATSSPLTPATTTPSAATTSPTPTAPASLTPTQSPSPAAATPTAATPTAPGPASGPLLPMGGRTIFPRFRVVAYYGNGQSTALGVLGHYSPDEAARRVAAVAVQWRTAQRPTVGAMELIVSIADGSAGPHGYFSHDTAPAIIQRYIDAARRHHQLVILDIQPGRRTFLSVATRYAAFLAQPDVGLALDPEWRMGPTDVPGRVIGRVDAAEVNDVSAWLSALTVSRRLPQKILIVHAFTTHMLIHPERLRARPGLAIVRHVDGFGGWSSKVNVYRLLHAAAPFFNGFKLFYTLDRPLAAPSAVLKLRPAPDFISYQ